MPTPAGSGRRRRWPIACARSRAWSPKHDIDGGHGATGTPHAIAFHKHARHRIKEIQRVARIHRDPFEPILPVLEADSPVGEYRKITEEIVRLMPDERRYPRAAAEAVRSFLLLRLGMHLGLRQRNLRELLVCPRGRMPTSETAPRGQEARRTAMERSRSGLGGPHPRPSPSRTRRHRSSARSHSGWCCRTWPASMT